MECIQKKVGKKWTLQKRAERGVENDEDAR
jgi:hypothetical protein